jgi:hypothetical protein
VRSACLRSSCGRVSDEAFSRSGYRGAWGGGADEVVIHVQKVGIDFDEVFAPEAR